MYLNELPKRVTSKTLDKLKKITPKVLREEHSEYVNKNTGEIVTGKQGEQIERQQKRQKREERKNRQKEGERYDSTQGYLPNGGDIIIDNIIESQEEINIQLGMTINLKDYGFKVVQVAFSNITETTTDFNVVIKIDLAKIKEEKMNKFPLNWIRKGVPESLYFSSTTTILKGANPFEYTTEGKSLIINNLSGEETDNIFTTINTFLKLGNSKEFSKVIGDTFINILIGNSSNSGLAYSLKDAGATDFSFETDATNNYFVIEK